ncbi:MAG: hypothetical protein B6241_05005 [Spirochaetaceae bacterium 4572_59]|nr:MAG: hypothetical protein B6241_05005 [Spirochaetaceae bacterium 4572_59]
MKKVINALIILCLIPFLFTGCRKKEEQPSITIAEQYGLAYAPLQIMKEKKFLETISPGTEVQWVRLANTAAIREAVLADELDAGFMGIPPFLLARDKKMPWKIATALSQAPLGLVVNDASIRTLNDFTPQTRLALPQPGSIQHILLCMALEKQKGDSTALDSVLVSMKHPDGMNALLSDSLEGHFTSPPYIFQEEDQKGFSLLLSGEEAMGESFSFIVGMVTEDFYRSHPDLYIDYLKALKQSVDFINEQRDESIEILSEVYDMDPEILKDYLSRPGMVFETEIRGLQQFIDFMTATNMIENIETAGDVIF